MTIWGNKPVSKSEKLICLLYIKETPYVLLKDQEWIGFKALCRTHKRDWHNRLLWPGKGNLGHSHSRAGMTSVKLSSGLTVAYGESPIFHNEYDISAKFVRLACNWIESRTFIDLSKKKKYTDIGAEESSQEAAAANDSLKADTENELESSKESEESEEIINDEGKKSEETEPPKDESTESTNQANEERNESDEDDKKPDESNNNTTEATETEHSNEPITPSTTEADAKSSSESESSESESESEVWMNRTFASVHDERCADSFFFFV